MLKEIEACRFEAVVFERDPIPYRELGQPIEDRIFTLHPSNSVQSNIKPSFLKT
jgi:hypothetical protein